MLASRLYSFPKELRKQLYVSHILYAYTVSLLAERRFFESMSKLDVVFDVVI